MTVLETNSGAFPSSMVEHQGYEPAKSIKYIVESDYLRWSYLKVISRGGAAGTENLARPDQSFVPFSHAW